MGNEEYRQKLNDLRCGIDNVDNALLYLLAERFRYIRKVGVLKASHKAPAVDSKREAQQMKRLRALAQGAGLPPDLAEKVFRFLINEAVADHHKVENEMLDK